MKRIAFYIMLSCRVIYGQDSTNFSGIHSGELFNFGSSSMYSNFAKAKPPGNSNLFISLTNRYGIDNLNNFNLAFTKKKAQKNIGISYSINQENNWLKHRWNAAIQMNYSEQWFFAPSLNIHLKNYSEIEKDPEYGASFSFGILYVQNNNWNISMQSSNIGRLNQNSSNMEITTGITYIYEKNLLLGLQMKISNSHTTINNSINILYLTNSRKAIYTQYSIEGDYFHIGFSYQKKQISWSILLGYHSKLGYSPSIEFNRFWI